MMIFIVISLRLKGSVPFSALTFALGISYYLYTFINYGRFTNMSALMLTTSMLVFFMGLVSEQITALMYKTENPSMNSKNEVITHTKKTTDSSLR